MRLLLVLGLVAASLAASGRYRSNTWEPEKRVEIQVNGYKPGYEYRSEYNGQVATGLPQTSGQHSATRIQALFTAQDLPGNKVVFFIRQIRIGSLNGELPEPREIQPFELYDEVELQQEHEKILKLPFRVSFLGDRIGDLEFDRDDESWSKNIKRAIVNLMQLNQQKIRRTDIEELQIEGPQAEKKEDLYTVQEKTLEGDCEVTYTTVPQPWKEQDESSFERVAITKSINFEKCVERPDIRYGWRFGFHNAEIKTVNTTHTTSVFTYNVTRRGNEFLIRDAEVKSQYIFAPLAESENVITTISLGRIVLNEVAQSTSVPSLNAAAVEDLQFSVEYNEKKERFFMDGDEEFLEHFPFGDVSNKVTLLEKVIGQLLKHTTTVDHSIDSQAPHMLARLVKLLRWATKANLQQISRKYFDESERLEQESVEKIQALFADALAIAGTKNTIDLLTQLISEKKIGVVKASHALKSLVNVPVPSVKQIDALVRLCQSSQSERNPILKQSCWLTTGAVIHALCGEKTEEKYAIQVADKEWRICPRSHKEKYVKLLIDQYHKAETRYEQVLALKTLANAGLDLSVFELEKIIRDPKVEKTMRMHAVDSLRRLRTVMPRKLHSILMPVFKNSREPLEVRVIAYREIMETMPERPVLDQIAVELRFAPVQLQSIVYTSMIELANSTNPFQKQLAFDLKTSLRQARFQEPRHLLNSRLKRLEFTTPGQEAGMFVHLGAVFGNSGFLPKVLTASMETVLAGELNKYALQVGVDQQNLDQIVVKAFDLLQSGQLEDVLVRGKRASNSAKEQLRELFKSLQIEGRQGKDQKVQTQLYIRYKDMDYAFLPIDEETLPELWKNVVSGEQIKLDLVERVLATGYRFHYHTAATLYEMSRQVPTSIGLPLVIAGKLPTVLSIRGHIKVDLEPKESRKLEGANVSISVEPRIASTHIVKMEIRCPILNNGLKVLHQLQASIPVDGSLKIVKEKGTIIIEGAYKLPQQEKRLLSLENRPVSFVRQWQKKSRVYVEAVERTIHSESLDDTVNLKETLGEQEIGIRMEVIGQWHRSILRQREPGVPSSLLLGANHLDIVYKPTSKTPKEIRGSIEMQTFDEEQSSDFELKESFYSKKVQFDEEEDFFDTEELEGEHFEEEKPRRDSYSRRANSATKLTGDKRRVVVKFETAEGVRREGEFIIDAICNKQIRVCKISLDGHRSVFSQEQNPKWRINAQVQTAYPEVPYTLKELKEQKNREYILQAQAEWGSQQKSQVTLKLQGEQNVEQKQWMRRVEEWENEQPVEVYERVLEASQLNQYKLVVDYKLSKDSQNFTNTLKSIYEAIKARYVWHSSVWLVENEEQRLSAKLTIDPRYRQIVNLTVETPRERLQLQDVQLPIKVNPINIRRDLGIISSVSSIVKSGVTGPRAECVVKTTRVNTFDDVLYKAPISTCYTVLAKDCADEEPEFVVLMKRLSKDSEEKKLKIISEDKVIEVEQTKNEPALKIVVNGQVISVENRRQLEEHNIEPQQNGEMVHIELDKVDVHFDGYAARVKLSSVYKGQQCGICGNYDDERSDEFRRNDNQLTDNLQEFHRSYVQKEDCEEDADSYAPKHYMKFDSDEQDSEERKQSIFAFDDEEEEEDYDSEEQKQKPTEGRHQGRKFLRKQLESSETEEELVSKLPVKRTHVVERGSEVCFSVKPVAVCPKKTYPTEGRTEDKQISFACIPRTDSKARKLLHQAHRGVVDVSEMQPSFQDDVTVPTQCEVY